jgi:hypothetical protein
MVATSDIGSDYASNYVFELRLVYFISGGIPTSVVCQKDDRIIAVTSVFFESFVPSCFVRHWNRVFPFVLNVDL